ncbi:hypothetical protein [uncultured Rothia sp.]|uniref:hypothetical protein n=1 Tax=uncultured Rothia sp. TaxID=316088 RepID=UPI002889180B|nr:hypothetical protein [uncultured Rothia sp.]
MTLTEGMKIISHRTSEERPEFHVATCEVFVQSTRRVEQMPLVFRYAADTTGTPCVYVHVAQLNRIMGFKNGAINGWIRERAKDGRSVGVFPSPIIKGLMTEKRGGGAQAQGVSLEFIIAELSRVPDRDRNKVLKYLRRWLYVVQQGYLYPGSGHVGLPESVRELPPWDTKPSGAESIEPGGRAGAVEDLGAQEGAGARSCRCTQGALRAYCYTGSQGTARCDRAGQRSYEPHQAPLRPATT